MKRSSSAELERAAKRPRLEAHTEEAQGIVTKVAAAADIPPTRPAIYTDNTMELIDESTPTTIHDLPLEILGNHVFKFFDFEYWLEYFVTVSKAWRNAAVQSNVDKQLHVKNLFATCIINQFRVSTLIIKFEAHLHEVATLINASPRITSVKFNCGMAYLESVWTPANISKFSFNNVSTLFLPARSLELLSFFPKASKVCFKGSNFPDEFLSNSVQEVTLQQDSLEEIKESLRITKGFFPEVKTFYFVVDAEEEEDTEEKVDEELATISNELGVTLVYDYNTHDGLLFDFAYHEYFNNFGKTPFCRAVRSLEELQLVFKKYPTLTLEYERDFITRKRQFLFPRIKLKTWKGFKFDFIRWRECKEQLNLCYEKKMLPPKGMLQHYVQQNNRQAAIETLKANNLHDVEWMREGLSLVQLQDILGAENFKKVVDNAFFKDTILDAESYEDLAPIKDLLSDEVLKYSYKALLQKMHDRSFSDVIFQYLIQIDSWLHPASSRRVSNQVCIGLQFLSDEAQAKYFKTLMKDHQYEKIMEESPKASKPVTQMFHKGKTLLAHVGNSRNLTEIVTKFKFDINQIDQKGKTILHYAIKRGDVQFIVDLLQLGADPNLAGNSLMPLHYSLSKETFSFSIVSALLAHGADINRRDFDRKGRTVWPITMALSHSPKAATLLLHFGADPTVIDEAGNTLLHILCRNGYCDTVEDFSESVRLLVPHIDINRKNNLGNTVLHYAIIGRFIRDIVEPLIQCGADINLPNIKGETPLLLACNNEDVLKFILATNRANIQARDKDGKSLVSYVFDYMQSTCAKLLQDEEFMTICKPYLTDDNECKKEIPVYHLHELALSHITIAKFLVELGYDVAAESYSILNSIDPEKHSEVFNYLLAHGLDINAKNEILEQTVLYNGMLEPFTPQLAKKIQFLIKHGASVTEKCKKGVAPIDIDPLIETRYANGLPVDYFLTSEDDELPEVNLMEFRQKMAKDK